MTSPASDSLPSSVSPEHYATLRGAIRARVGVAYLVTWEDERTRILIEYLGRSVSEEPVPCYIWSVTEGLRLDDKPVEGTHDLAAALRHAAQQPGACLFLFRDVPPFLSDPIVCRAVRDCFRTSRHTGRTVFLTGTKLVLPGDLLKEVQVFELGLPSTDALTALVDELTAHEGSRAALEPEHRDALVNAVRGLTLEEAEIALRTAFLGCSAASAKSVTAAAEFKRQLIKKLGILHFVDNRVDEATVGGLDTLKGWLAVRRDAFGTQARAHNLKPPKGVLVMGVPGCGKSLAVRLAAGMWKLPLLRLDLANIYSGAFGTPEESLYRALAVSEAVAPVVLWIDEIEKGIAGIRSSDTGVVARVLGTFLTWMQEKTAPVFVGATANMIDLLPPEVLRKGRFDEIFFIDLPSVKEREAIWQLHLRQFKIVVGKLPASELAKITAQYTGAEIEQVAANAAFAALAEHREPTDRDVLTALGRTVPLAKTMEEKIREIRNWATDRAARASPKD